MDDKKKNKNKSPAWAVVVLLLMLLRALNDGNMAVLPVIIIGLSIVAVIGIVMASTKKANARSGEKPQPPRASRPAAREAKPLRLRQERAAFQPRREAYTPDNGDKYIAQLNGFLKNGIIERSDYNYLLKKSRNNYTKRKQS